MQIKICGLRTVADALACVTAGVDLAGLNFVPASRRYVGAGAAAVRAALGSVKPVGVFADTPADQIRAHAEAIDLSWIQLHGKETPADCAALSGYAIIKAVDHDALSRPADLRAYAPHVAAFLVDGRVPGSGRPWDFRTLQPHLENGQLWKRPVFVAGGLDPENVAGVVTALAPYGVDVASGIEIDHRPDPGRITAFCAAARRARREAA